MSVQPVTPQRIRELKRHARQLSRRSKDKTYMQCLDIICREQMGLRHFHEAQKLAARTGTHRTTKSTTDESRSNSSPWTLYLQACQEAYFEI